MDIAAEVVYNSQRVRRTKVILDVDTGIDDAITLLVAAFHPALSLCGVTVVAGNGPLALTLSNTLAIIGAAGLRGVRVYRGASRSLLGHEPPRLDIQQTAIHSLLPPPAPESESAALWLSSYYRSPAGRSTIYVATGPVTNVALALLLDPELRNLIPRVVLFAGANAKGNVSPSAEFNAYCDPEALQILLTSGVRVEVVPLEVARAAYVSSRQLALLSRLPGVPAALVTTLLRVLLRWTESRYAHRCVPVFDLCPIAAIAEKHAAVFRPAIVHVALSGSRHRGRTVIRPVLSGSLQTNPVFVATRLSRAGLFRCLSTTLTASPRGSSTPRQLLLSAGPV